MLEARFQKFVIEKEAIALIIKEYDRQTQNPVPMVWIPQILPNPPIFPNLPMLVPQARQDDGKATPAGDLKTFAEVTECVVSISHRAKRNIYNKPTDNYGSE